MECTLKLFLKSAVAFFFLFFPHGFSIENGQQGISYNVFGLGAVVSACAWGNCAKPVLAAGGIIQH